MIFRRKNVDKVESGYDIVLLILILMISLFGLIMIYSASSYNAAKYYSDPTKYLKRQGMFLAMGAAAMIGISQFDYHLCLFKAKWFPLRPIWLLYIFCAIAQYYVMIAGYSAGGSSRWLSLIPGFGNFQPSELIKVCVILIGAFAVQKSPLRIEKFSGFLGIFVYVVILLIPVAKLNLSSAIIIAGIFITICFCATRRKWYYLIVAIAAVVAIICLICFVDYRSGRIANWIDPSTFENGDQILEGMYAIASGGVFGKGLGQSVQKLGFIPEVHTDMIFTIICEELGLFGAGILMLIYLMILWRIYCVAVNAPDMFGGLIVTGAFAHIAIQLILNIAVVTNMIPATGVTLPFISYGGSSLFVLMCEMGIVLSVSKYTAKE